MHTARMLYNSRGTERRCAHARWGCRCALSPEAFAEHGAVRRRGINRAAENRTWRAEARKEMKIR